MPTLNGKTFPKMDNLSLIVHHEEETIKLVFSKNGKEQKTIEIKYDKQLTVEDVLIVNWDRANKRFFIQGHSFYMTELPKKDKEKGISIFKVRMNKHIFTIGVEQQNKHKAFGTIKDVNAPMF